jgi:hypothetical protein
MRDEDARALLGGISQRTLDRMKRAGRTQWTLPVDTLTRISLIMGIWKALQIVHSGPLADKWVNERSGERIFKGQTPLAYMIQGGIPAMSVIRRELDDATDIQARTKDDPPPQQLFKEREPRQSIETSEPRLQSSTSTRRSAGILIETPKDGEKLSVPISIKGKLEEPLPNDTQLWLFALGTKTGRDAYWPHRRAIVNSDRSWSVLYKPGPHLDGDRRRLQMVLVGQEGQALIESYRHTNAQVVPPGAPWPALMAITSDMVHACPTLEIFLTGVPDFSGVWQGMWLSMKTERGHHASLVIPVQHGPTFSASMTVTYERSGRQTVVEETLTGAIIDRTLSLIGVSYKYVERGASSSYSLDNFSLKVSDDSNSLSGRAVLRNGVRDVMFRRAVG